VAYRDDLGLPDRFWRRVRKGEGEKGCWIWTGARSSGYGRFGMGKAILSTHVLVLERKLGRKLLPGKECLHSCDNRACIRPEHLAEGTRLENVADCRAKGRFKLPTAPDNRGEAHGMAKLTEADVRWACTCPLTQRETAGKLGVGPSVISRIRAGQTWRHLGLRREETRVS
jgi:hypothetical protein